MSASWAVDDGYSGPGHQRAGADGSVQRHGGALGRDADVAGRRVADGNLSWKVVQTNAPSCHACRLTKHVPTGESAADRATPSPPNLEPWSTPPLGRNPCPVHQTSDRVLVCGQERMVDEGRFLRPRVAAAPIPVCGTEASNQGLSTLPSCGSSRC